MKLELTEQEINYIYSLLRKRPHEESDELIRKIMHQISLHQEAEQSKLEAPKEDN